MKYYLAVVSSRPRGPFFILQSFPRVEPRETAADIDFTNPDRLTDWLTGSNGEEELRQDEIPGQHQLPGPATVQEESTEAWGKDQTERAMMERCLTIQIRPSEEEEEEPGSSGLFSNSHTVLILTVMVGCFGVLWPKIFSPMFFGDQDQRDSQPDLSEESLSSCEVSPYRPQDDQCSCCSWWNVTDVTELSIFQWCHFSLT